MWIFTNKISIEVHSGIGGQSLFLTFFTIRTEEFWIFYTGRGRDPDPDLGNLGPYIQKAGPADQSAFFSCPQQLYTWPCWSVCLSVQVHEPYWLLLTIPDLVDHGLSFTDLDDVGLTGKEPFYHTSQYCMTKIGEKITLLHISISTA